MLKNQSVLEIKKNERIYQLLLSSDSPLGEVHDVLHEMKTYVVEIMIERSKPQEEKKVEVDPEVIPEPGVE